MYMYIKPCTFFRYKMKLIFPDLARFWITLGEPKVSQFLLYNQPLILIVFEIFSFFHCSFYLINQDADHDKQMGISLLLCFLN